MTRIYPMENQEQMLDQKYFEEIEELYGREWPFTFMMLGTIAYRSLYIAARENGFNQNRAASLCTSKWIRKTEDSGWLTECMAKMFSDVGLPAPDDYIIDDDYDLKSIDRIENMDSLIRDCKNLKKTWKKVGFR